ncbi:MAG: WD40 repeat domain-containing protein [Reichenbachiella sp.]
MRLLAFLYLVTIAFTCSSQGFRKVKSKIKHSGAVNIVSNSSEFFATAGKDGNLFIWDYSGKVVGNPQLMDVTINSIEFISNSNLLLVGLTETKQELTKRFVIKCFDNKGNEQFELIDSTLTQELTDNYYQENTKSVQSAIKSINQNFTELKTNELQSPEIDKGLSHFDLVQDIEVSPSGELIASIDKFNILKIWDKSGSFIKSMNIDNGKKNTEIYFLDEERLLISPNIILNIDSSNLEFIQGFEKYSGIPFSNSLYFYFDYNDNSRPEQIYNQNTSNIQKLDDTEFYTFNTSRSDNTLALLGFDRLIRVIKEDGSIISKFGKDRKLHTTFRGDKLTEFSNISCLGISPNGTFVVSGNEDGKVVIWKNGE